MVRFLSIISIAAEILAALYEILYKQYDFLYTMRENYKQTTEYLQRLCIIKLKF